MTPKEAAAIIDRHMRLELKTQRSIQRSSKELAAAKDQLTELRSRRRTLIADLRNDLSMSQMAGRFGVEVGSIRRAMRDELGRRGMGWREVSKRESSSFDQEMRSLIGSETPGEPSMMITESSLG